MARHKLENELIAIEVEEHGAELKSLVRKNTGKEYMWKADPKFWGRTSPVLFPFVGAVKDKQFRTKGQTYTMGQHGFARDMEFICTDKTDTSVTHLLESTEETLKHWPYIFQLYITHTLNERDLTVSWKVVNKSQETMYFTIGAHPAFNVPVLPDTVQSQYHLTFNGEKELSYCLLNPEYGTVIPDKTYTLHLENNSCPIDEHMFDHDALVFDNGQITKAGIALPDGTPYVEISCDGFPNFGIWAAAGAPFVCLEPWMGRCDNTGYDKELSQKPNINELKPDEIFDQSYMISVK